MKKTMLFAAAFALAACARGEEYEADGTVDTTNQVVVPNVDVDVRKDTVNMPEIGTEKDTIVVKKPTIKP